MEKRTKEETKEKNKEGRIGINKMN